VVVNERSKKNHNMDVVSSGLNSNGERFPSTVRKVALRGMENAPHPKKKQVEGFGCYQLE
jgi:hypothetical protein